MRTADDDGHARAVAVFLWALVAHLVFNALLFSLGTPRLGSIEYHQIAVNLAAGHGFVLEPGEPPVLWRPPLYALFLGGLYAAFGQSHLAVVLVQSVVQSAAAAGTFVIGRAFLEPRLALIGSALLALHPLVLYNSGRYMSESLFTALLVGAVLAWMALRRAPSPAAVIRLGVVLGLAVLCRASMQPLVLLIALAVTVERWRFGRRRALAFAAAVVVVVLAVVAPWTVRNYVASDGHVVLLDTSGGYSLWTGNHVPTRGFDDDGLTPAGQRRLHEDLAREIGLDVDAVTSTELLHTAWGTPEHDTHLFRAALASMVAHPGETAVLWLQKLHRFWFDFLGEDPTGAIGVTIALLQVLVLVPASLGMYVAWRDRLTSAWPSALVVIGTVATHVVVLANARYSVPILPFMMLFAMLGAAPIVRRLPWVPARHGALDASRQS